jgi:hypothetical protein
MIALYATSVCNCCAHILNLQLLCTHPQSATAVHTLSTYNDFRCKTAYLRCSPEEVDARYRSMPAALQSALMPFQREGIRYRRRAIVEIELAFLLVV